jgi:hypothetical protein
MLITGIGLGWLVGRTTGGIFGVAVGAITATSVFWGGVCFHIWWITRQTSPPVPARQFFQLFLMLWLFSAPMFVLPIIGAAVLAKLGGNIVAMMVAIVYGIALHVGGEWFFAGYLKFIRRQLFKTNN